MILSLIFLVKTSNTIVSPIPSICCKQILLEPSKDGVLRQYFNTLDLDKFNYQPTFRQFKNEIGLHTMTYNAATGEYHIIHDATGNVIVKIFAGKGICPEHATIFQVDTKPGEGHWTLDLKSRFDCLKFGCCQTIILKSQHKEIKRYFHTPTLATFVRQNSSGNYENESKLHTMKYNSAGDEYHIIYDDEIAVVRIFAKGGMCPEDNKIFLVDEEPGKGLWVNDTTAQFGCAN